MKKIMPVFVTSHTYSWTINMVSSFMSFFPSLKMLAIDNNPYKNQVVKNLFYHKYDGSWNKTCEAEREFINSHPKIEVLPIYKKDPIVDSIPYHGKALDYAVDWLKDKNIEVMILLEPDCIIKGKKWLEQLLIPIANGYWQSHSTKLPNNIGYPCVSAWLVDKINCSMDCYTWKDKLDPFEVYKVINYSSSAKAIHKREPKNEFEFWEAYGWDTAQRCWYECAKVGKAKYVGDEEPTAKSIHPVGKLIDLEHFWGGSTRLNPNFDVKLI